MNSPVVRVKVAIVGAGHWGKNLARNLHELGVLCAVCDVDSHSAQILCEQYNVPALKFEQLLFDVSIDALVISAPARLHHGLAKRALEAGKHVFVEKPMTLRVADALELHELARARGKKLMVGHLLQYHPIFVRLKELVKEGTLGEIKYAYSHRLDFGKFYPEEDVIWNLAPHDISMILSLMGAAPESVHTVQGARDASGLADSAILHLNFSHNRKAHVFVSRLSPFKEQKLTVVGCKMMAVFDDTQTEWSNKLWLRACELDGSLGSPQFVAVIKSEPLRNECLHFIQCIVKDTEPITNGREALNVLKALEG
jgi:predicted dehydrogenase